jgi:hypothetical protein
MARPPGGGRSTCESCTYIDIREWKRVVASGVGCMATTFTLLQAAAIVEADGKADDKAQSPDRNAPALPRCLP